MMNRLKTKLGQYTIERFPLPENKKAKNALRAWDAADEYLLSYLAEKERFDESANILIINDSFGALAVSLSQYKPMVVVDSYLAMQAIISNAKLNNIEADNITLSADLSIQSLTEKPDVVLLKIPKSLAMLEDILYQLRPFLTKQTVIISASMSRHLHRSNLDLFEKIIGETKTSLAVKKSRLIFSRYQENVSKNAVAEKNPYPNSYAVPELNLTLSNQAGVFSQHKLDIGTRFFINHIPEHKKYHTIVDLGCGNGVLGIVAAIKNEAAKLVFTDISYRAVETAMTNFQTHFAEHRHAEFLQTEGLFGVEDNSISLILCNPPFHQDHAITDDIAWRMFKQSRHALQNNAEIWVVANHHLGYRAKLKKIFGHCELVASNKKFVILKAVKK